MYQGKFNQKGKKGSADPMELLAQRNAAAAKEPPVKPAPVREGRPVRENPAPAAPVQKNPPQKAAPAKQTAPVKQTAPARKTGPRAAGVIFYTFYFMLIALFCGGLFLGLRYVQGWLVEFEAAQPTTKCEQVFTQLFENPDWGKLYDLAAAEDTTYEGKDAVISYMKDKVGDSKLSYIEIPAGLSGDKKYLVRLGDEKIASFTLTDKTKTDGALTDIAAIPEWELQKVELFFSRTNSYRIRNQEGHSVYVNGVALGEDCVIEKSSTIATKYLPRAVPSVVQCTQEVHDLLIAPTVTVFDESGTEMEVTYDEETRTFTEHCNTNTITPEVEETVLTAARTYGLYMIEKASQKQVAKYFDASSNAYKTIVKSKFSTIQNNRGYEFSDESVSEFARYADDLFSARVDLNLNVTRTDKSVKTWEIGSTYFFQKQSTDKWLVFEMTNVDVQQTVGQVRLTFMSGENTLSSQFYDAHSTELITPLVSVPEGKVFSGWVRETVDADGVTTLTVVFSPDETGRVAIPAGTSLEPMTLHALFENAPAIGNEGG